MPWLFFGSMATSGSGNPKTFRAANAGNARTHACHRIIQNLSIQHGREYLNNVVFSVIILEYTYSHTFTT